MARTKSNEKVVLTEEQQAAKVRDAEKRKKKKEEKKRLKALRVQEEQLVQRTNDSEEVRALKERLLAAEAQAKTAQEELATILTTRSQHASNTSTNEEPIPRPSNLNKVTVNDVRRHLNLEGPENKRQWNQIRTMIRRCIQAAHIEWDTDWKGQKTRHLSRIYDAVDEAVPIMRRFKNQWATELLARDYFAGRKTYESCMDNPSTYRGRARLLRQHHSSSMPTVSHNTPASRPQTPVTNASIDGNEHLNISSNNESELLDGNLPDLSSEDDNDDRHGEENMENEACGNEKAKSAAKKNSATSKRRRRGD